MLNAREKKTTWLNAMAWVAMLGLAWAFAGCGTDENYESQSSAKAKKAPTETQVSTVSKPVASPPATDVTPEPEVAVVPETTTPAPPKVVTWAEAEGAFFDRRYDEAVALLTAYTNQKSDNPWGFYMLGLASWKAGDYTGAENAFEQALALDPEHVKSHINLTRVLLETDRPDYALVQIHEAMALDPESGTARRLEGRAYYGLGKVDEAIASYREAIRIDEDDAWSMNNLALVLIDEGRFAEAIPPLARAIELHGDVAVFRNNLGMALERTGRFRAAEEAYREAVAADDGYEKAHANLVRIELVAEEPGVEPIDLTAAALEFVDQIDQWQLAAATVDESRSGDVEISGVAIGAVDSTSTGQEQ